jgi:hypothetical protein
MRLPGGPDHGNLQQEDEWRISLDISKISSSIMSERLVRTGLLPSALGEITPPSVSDELEPMISFNGGHGLWLHDLRLREASSFRFEIL